MSCNMIITVYDSSNNIIEHVKGKSIESPIGNNIDYMFEYKDIKYLPCNPILFIKIKNNYIYNKNNLTNQSFYKN